MKRFTRQHSLTFILALFVLCLLMVAGYWYRERERSQSESADQLITALAQPAEEGFARATEPNAIQFPRDLGEHPDYQTEWWYYTGNLQTAEGREFGFQLTFFRRALAPLSADLAASPSAWQTNQLYFAHFAISDIANERFYADERFSRGAVGLAGAQAEPYRVWIEDWQAIAQEEGKVRLSAEQDDYALDLTVSETMPPILHGDGGLSAKSLQQGNASYYYSLVQQTAEGRVRVGGETVAVTGKVWKDHEYSTSVLGEGAVGWDWFSMQFVDGSALMLFHIRREDGSLEPASSGTWIGSDGTVEAFALGDWSLEVTDYWTSGATQARYPSAWELTIPRFAVQLIGRAKMPNQELILNVGAYWEGAVGWSGTHTGAGYVEMTGYK